MKKNHRNELYYKTLIENKLTLKTELKKKFCSTFVIKKYKKKEEMETFHGKFTKLKINRNFRLSKAMRNLINPAVIKLEIYFEKKTFFIKENQMLKKLI